MRAPDRKVADLAAAILDGTPVDWPSAEAHADEDERELLEQLRVLAVLADVHREAPGPSVSRPVQPPAGDDPTTLEHWGPLRVLEPVARGSFGTVYRAWDTRLDREVALKLLPASSDAGPGGATSVIHEGRLLARVRHPNVVAVYGAEQIENRIGVWMEFIRGATLEQALESGRVFSVEEAVDIGMKLCDAVSAVHGSGLLHRDIKAQNVALAEDGRVVLMDLGAGREVADDPSPDFTGTPLYLPPEIFEGQQASVRSDIYSLGVVLYHLVTRSYPVVARNVGDIRGKHQRGERTSLRDVRPDLPESFVRVVECATAKDPAARYDTATAMKAALAAAVAVPAQRSRGRAKWAAALVVIAVAGSAWSQWRSRPPADTARDDYVRLTNFADSVTSPAVSPDGKLLTFIRGLSSFQGAGQIYVKVLPDGEPKQLTQDGLSKMSPVFSPDGSRIAYTTVDGSNEWDTWDVPVLGGQARKWLPNASGLVWVDRQNVLFSEKIRDSKGNHMKVVAATENRAGARDLYVPLPKGAMAHRSFPSPDGRWVVVVEMDDRGDWLPCRVVPMDGSSTGRQVGPPGTPCWFAAWSPDGKWMYLNSLVGGTFQILRQRFSERGALTTSEPITSGPLEHEGISLTTDGRSLVTAVGLRQSSVWLVVPQGERQGSQEGHAEHATFNLDGNARQISLEGYAKHPKFTPDGKRLLYLTGKSASGPKELWMAELDTGRSEPVLPDFRMNEYAGPRVPYDISPDGQRVVVEISDAEGRNRLWLAPLDRRSPPRQIPNVEGDGPLFLSNEEVVFRGREGDYGFVYRVRTDGTELRKLSDHSVISTTGLSRDGQWLVVYARPSEEKAGGTLALPLGGGPPIQLVGRGVLAAWSTSGRQLFLSQGSTVGEAGATYIVPLSRGEAFPTIPAEGLLNTKAIAGLPGVQVIDSADVAPGPAPGVFAVSRVTVQLNIYRIPIP